ncbi:MAG: hypothetical protein KGO50_05560 [Myxococcales bacterium]|nr:hypothetical protein [Myxococcales bacterium]
MNTAETWRAKVPGAGAYAAYVVLFNTYLWMPVFFLWYLRWLSLSQVLLLEAVYYVAVVVLEVPAGVLSDRLSRRGTLIAAAACQTASAVLVCASSTFAGFAVAQVLFAAAIALNSGSDTSLHYELLQKSGREAEYEQREARIATWMFRASALGAAVGGVLSLVSPVLTWAATAMTSTGALLAATRIPGDQTLSARAPGPAPGVGEIIAISWAPALRWYWLLAVGMVVLNHLPYEFYAAYIDLVQGREPGASSAGAGIDGSGSAVVWWRNAALLAGLHMAAGSWLASVLASRSARWSERWGNTAVLLSGVVLQTGVIVGMATVVHPVMAGLTLLRGLPRGLQQAPLQAATVPLIPREIRATWLSVQSLVGRLAFAAVLVGLSALIPGNATAAQSLALTLDGAGVIAAGVLAFLLVLRVRRPAE